MVSFNAYLLIAVVLFVIGAIGVVVRRNAIIILMCVELMLAAANLVLVAASRHFAMLDGQVATMLMLTVAVGGLALGLALVVHVFRRHKGADADVDTIDLMRW